MSTGLRPAGAAVKQWGRSVKRPGFLSARSPPNWGLQRADRAVRAAPPALSAARPTADPRSSRRIASLANPCRTRGKGGAPIGSLRSGLLSNNQARGFAWPMNGSPFGRLHEPCSQVGRKDSTRSQANFPGCPWGCVMGPLPTRECYPTRQLHPPRQIPRNLRRSSRDGDPSWHRRSVESPTSLAWGPCCRRGRPRSRRDSHTTTSAGTSLRFHRK